MQLQLFKLPGWVFKLIKYVQSVRMHKTHYTQIIITRPPCSAFTIFISNLSPSLRCNLLPFALTTVAVKNRRAGNIQVEVKKLQPVIHQKSGDDTQMQSTILFLAVPQNLVNGKMKINANISNRSINFIKEKSGFNTSKQ